MGYRTWNDRGLSLPGYCTDCDKQVYASRKAARDYSRQRSLSHLRVYHCPFGKGFHRTSGVHAIIRGDVAKSEWVEYRPQRAHTYRVTPRIVVDHLTAVLDFEYIGSRMACTIARFESFEMRAPTWNELFEALPAEITQALNNIAPEWTDSAELWSYYARPFVMQKLKQLGWIRFNRQKGSLRVGDTARGVASPATLAA